MTSDIVYAAVSTKGPVYRVPACWLPRLSSSSISYKTACSARVRCFTYTSSGANGYAEKIQIIAFRSPFLIVDAVTVESLVEMKIQYIIFFSCKI
ncbi:hypothetical protein O181_129035 [Austropuccinia psidii MF-1]|uniref:Uncharacterized protein n=1 Tax=Austropuccinia psidii MF-1 TaxID=1389203 RepID=A0A9Q3KWE2_9BASI|nr:hypothetical protein [Austropuccinia psidii MF-1]